MAWGIFIIDGTVTGIITAILLLATVIFSFYLMMRDKEAKWNLMLIAMSCLAFSVIFDVLETYILSDLFNLLEHLFMMLSALLFASTLIIYSRKKSQEKK